MAKKKLLSLFLILFSAGLIGVVGLTTLRGRKTDLFPTKTSTPSSTLKPVLNWEQYENSEYHLRFQYPPEFEVEELTGLAPNFLQVNLSKNQNAQSIIMVRGDYQPADVSYFVGAEPLEEKEINGQDWYFFNFPEGYSRSRPFTTFQRDEAGLLYSLKFYDLVSDELRDQIMATVQITP